MIVNATRIRRAEVKYRQFYNLLAAASAADPAFILLVCVLDFDDVDKSRTEGLHRINRLITIEITCGLRREVRDQSTPV